MILPFSTKAFFASSRFLFEKKCSIVFQTLFSLSIDFVTIEINVVFLLLNSISQPGSFYPYIVLNLPMAGSCLQLFSTLQMNSHNRHTHTHAHTRARLRALFHGDGVRKNQNSRISQYENSMQNCFCLKTKHLPMYVIYTYDM